MQTASFRTLGGNLQSGFSAGVFGLAGRLEECIEEYNLLNTSQNCILEVEGRLGFLKEYDSNDGISLPVETYVLLEKANEGFDCLFDFGMTEISFLKLVNALNHFLGVHVDENGVALAESRVFNRDKVILTNTIDHIIPVSDTLLEKFNIKESGEDSEQRPSIRASYHCSNNSTGSRLPSEVLRKKKLFVLDFYTPKSCHESTDNNETYCPDIRIAVNLEFHLPVHIELPRPIRTRRRQRVSYPILGKFRIDTTRVKNYGRKSRHVETTSYEIEVEVNPHYLLQEFQKKLHGQPHFVYHLLQDLFNLLLSMSSFIASNNMSRFQTTADILKEKKTKTEDVSIPAANPSPCRPLIDLRVNTQPNELLEKYTNRIGNVFPLIGDYLFRAVASEK